MTTLFVSGMSQKSQKRRTTFEIRMEKLEERRRMRMYDLISRDCQGSQKWTKKFIYIPGFFRRPILIKSLPDFFKHVGSFKCLAGIEWPNPSLYPPLTYPYIVYPKYFYDGVLMFSFVTQMHSYFFFLDTISRLGLNYIVLNTEIW